MGFERLTIRPDNGGDPIEVLYNPKEFSIQQGNKFAETSAIGMSAPILQFLQGNARTLTMDLFFDRFEAGKDVRDITDQIYGLFKPAAPDKADKGKRGRPPICQLQWGKEFFKGVLESVTGRFTLFLEDGTPVRATLNVTFREYVDFKIDQTISTEATVKQRKYVVKSGDTLWAISGKELGDPTKWRIIGVANGIADPTKLKIGTELTIPK